jgi:adenylate cyclase
LSSAPAKDNFGRNFTIGLSLVFLVLYWPTVFFLPFNSAFDHLEDRWHDALFQLHESNLAPGDPRIIIAAMDDDTVHKHGFPLPRRLHAKVLDRLKEYGVKTVAFDVIFTEKQGPDDKELVAATKRFKKVIHLFTTQAVATQHGEVVEVHPPFEGLGEAAELLGYPNIDLMLDSDGHLRRSMLFDKRTSDPKNPERIAPTLDIAALSSFLDKPLDDFLEIYGKPEPKIVLINFRRMQEWFLHEARDQDKVGKVANIPYWPSPYRTISLLDILSGNLTPAQKKALKGALVIIGSTTTGYFDHYPTPFTPQSPGAEYHANNIDNMMHGDFLVMVPRTVTALAILLMAVLPLFLLRLPPAAGNTGAAFVLGGWTLLAYVLFGRGDLIEYVAPALAFSVSFIAQTAHRVFAERKEKGYIKNLFGQFVAPEVVEDLARDPGRVKLGGEKRDLTMFFLDIAHFTTISESMAPEALILFLNKYLSALSKVVQDEKGVVDKYIGDCIMAFWNAPLEVKDHRARACLAAIQCQEAMHELNKHLDPSMPETPEIRIGLNSGDAIVGLTGSDKKLQYTVIGDEVNLASRLEGANKFFGSKIMASESTVSGAGDTIEKRELGRVRVVGKSEPIKVFELLAKKGGLNETWKKALPLYEKGVAHFNKRQFAAAQAAFQEFIKLVPNDGPGTLYLNVSSDYAAIAPPDDWDGVFNLTAK